MKEVKNVESALTNIFGSHYYQFTAINKTKAMCVFISKYVLFIYKKAISVVIFEIRTS